MAQLPQTESNTVTILSVVWYKVLPPKFGGQKAAAMLNQYLGGLAPLHCLCSKNNEAIATSYAVHPVLPVSKRQFLNPFVWRTIYLFARKHSTTHLLLEFPYHGIAALLTKQLLGLKLVVHEHNIECLRFKEQQKWWWPLLYFYEGWVLRRAELVFFKTADDRQTAIETFGLKEERTALLPYGVAQADLDNGEKLAAEIRLRHGIQPQEKLLLFAGTLDYQPNAEAVMAIRQKLLPQLSLLPFSFKIVICGRNKLREFQYLNKETHPNIIMAGEVADIHAYFAAADVFINPVLTGGGVQTKILDALSYHLNVVCFQSRARGIVHAEKKLFCVKDGSWEKFVQAVAKAVAHRSLTSTAFFEHYNWRSIAAKAYHKMSSA